MDSKCHPHLVAALQGVVSAPDTSAGDCVACGVGWSCEAWERSVLWRHAEEDLHSHWEDT